MLSRTPVPTIRTQATPFLVLAALAGACAPPPQPDRFDVIVVTLDTTRADRIGAYGGTAVPTPNLDAIARDGVLFEAAISPVPLTLPAHSSIFTGRYPAAHGVRHNGIYRLPESETTLAERLRQAGFATAAFVGAYVLNEPYGLAQGFAAYDDIPADRYQGGRDNLYEAQRSAEEVNAAFFGWLDTKPPGRFFAWLHYYDPHLPYSPPENPSRKLHGAGYDREISYVDACLGELLARLKKAGSLDRTLFIVVGDHGESLGEHRELTHGVFLYEGVVHVPWVIRAPGLVPRGRRVAAPVGLVDVAPTVLDLLGLPPLDATQGTSAVAKFGDTSAGLTDLVYAETFMPRIEFGWSELLMARDLRYKYIEAPTPELYDLDADPKELTNLIGVEAERAAEMSDALRDWLAKSTSTGAEERAGKSLTPEEEARLHSLGYLGGGRSGASAAGGRLPDPKDRIDEGLILSQVRDRLVAGRYDDALTLVDPLVRDNPLNHLAKRSRLQALVHLERLVDAEAQARDALAAALADRNASPMLEEQARRALASVLWMNGKQDEAQTEYREAIALSQGSDKAPVFGGLLLGAAGGREEALRLVADALRRHPNDGMALAARFELEHAASESAQALVTAGRLAELRAGDPDTLIKAGQLARDQGQPALALALFRIAQEKDPKNADAAGHLGLALLAAGELDEAARRLEAASTLRPKDPRAPFYLGNIALLRKDSSRARHWYAKALERDPTFVPPLLNMARFLAENGHLSDALASVEDALRRRPGDPEAERLRAELAASTARGVGSGG